MRYILLYVTFFIFTVKSVAQFDSSISIIENAILTRKDVNKIIYLDSSINCYSTSRFAKKGKVVGYRGTTKVSVNLSKDEINFLDSEVKKTRPVAWSQNMFENSFMITSDSLEIFSDPTKGKTYFEKNFSKKYFLFSNPVFIRNNTLAIFRLVELYRPVAGYDLLYFYQKSNGNWQQYMLVPLGAW